MATVIPTPAGTDLPTNRDDSQKAPIGNRPMVRVAKGFGLIVVLGSLLWVVSGILLVHPA